MPQACSKIFTLNQEEISVKVPFVIYGEKDSLLEKYTHVISI